MFSSIKETIYFDLDFATCGFESFKMNMINVIPKFFEVVDKIPSKTLILSLFFRKMDTLYLTAF